MAQLNALVVDDKADNLKLVSRLLSKLEIGVQCASSGDEAVKLVLNSGPDSKQFDFLMLDIHMPNMSGIEVAKLVREGGFKGAIFAFTAHATMEAKKRGEGSGIDAYLSKGTLKRELIEALIAEYVKR